jgi:hypothetical protein
MIDAVDRSSKKGTCDRVGQVAAENARTLQTRLCEQRREVDALCVRLEDASAAICKLALEHGRELAVVLDRDEAARARGQQSAERACPAADFDNACAADFVIGNASQSDGASNRFGYEKVLTKVSFGPAPGVAQCDSRVMPVARAGLGSTRCVRLFALQEDRSSVTRLPRQVST